jgi:hypothetical protein
LLERGYGVWIQSRTYVDGKRGYEIGLSGNSALRLLNRLVLRHPEKIRARQIALLSETNPQEARDSYLFHRRQVLQERDAFVEDARNSYLNRNQRKLERRNNFEVLVKRAAQLRLGGKRISEIGTTLGRSERTVYRLLRRCRFGERTAKESEQASG